MFVSIEISYYPLTEDYNVSVNNFIRQLNRPDIAVETGTMSTLITGEYNEVMNMLTKAMDDSMNKYPSVFNIKISNACIVKNE